jgi:O-methyltransferase
MSLPANLYLDLLKNCLTASLYDESAWQVIDDGRSPRDKTLRRPLRFLKGLIRHWVISRWRRKSGLLLVSKRPLDVAKREEGRDWPYFGYTMIGHRRLENVRTCVEEILRNNVPGDFIETGVWRGGTTIFMRALLRVYGVTDRTVWVADSFEGMPRPTSSTDTADLSHLEQLKVPLEQVQANFAKFGLLDDQVRFLKGWFSDTLATAPIKQLAILRLDGDLYSSTMDALHALYHRVSPGGYVIVDDYNGWASCHRAVNDFRLEQGIRAQIQTIDWTGVYWKVEA